MRTYDRITHIIDGNLDEPIAISIPSISFPFVGDTNDRIYSQQFIIKKDKYDLFLPVNGDRWEEDSDYLWLKDDGFTDIIGGYLQYTRHWGLLPFSNTGASGQRMEFGSMVWTKPGFTTEDTEFMLYFVDTSKLVVSSGAVTLYTYGAHNLTDTKYKYAQVNYTVIDPVSALNHNRTTVREILSRGTDFIVVPNVVDGNGGSIYYNWFSKPQLNREPIQVVVPYIDFIDYWMPSVNCDNVEEIPIIQQWSILDSLGNETEYLSENSHPPLWDNAATGEDGYYTMVANREMITVEPSIVNRWGFGGDIYERRTKYIHIV